jgi:Concanavalin A-like lectin/glucanases superfamily
MAIRFDGSTGKLSRTTNLPAMTTFTVMGWLSPAAFPAAGGLGGLYSHGSAAGGSFYAIGVGNSSGNKLAIYTGTALVYGATILTTNTWVHAAMTVSGTGANQQIAYLNGVQQITGTAASGFTAVALIVGTTAGGDPLNGRGAALKVYGAVLTADEIRTEMATYLPTRLANLLSWHPMLLHTDTAQYGTTWTAAGTLTTEPGPPIAWGRVTPSTPLPVVVAAATVLPRLPTVQLQAVASGLL